MFKKLENFLVERCDRWVYILILSFFFAFPLWRWAHWATLLSYLQTLELLMSIGLVADFITLVVGQKQS